MGLRRDLAYRANVPLTRARRFPNRDYAKIVVPRSPDHDSMGTERVCAESDKPSLSLSRFMFNRHRQWVAQDSVAFGKRDTMLLEIGGVLLGIKDGGLQISVCI